MERVRHDETIDFSSRCDGNCGPDVRHASAQFQYGMNYFEFDNWDNGGGDGSGPAFQPGGWTATTSGAIWISTGGAHADLEHAGPELRIGLPVHSHFSVDGHHQYLPDEHRRGAMTSITIGHSRLSGLLDGQRRRDWLGKQQPRHRRPTDDKGSGILPAGNSKTRTTPMASRPKRGCSSICTPGRATTTATLPPSPAARRLA